MLYDKWDTILVDLLFVTFFSEKVKSLTCLIPYMSPEKREDGGVAGVEGGDGGHQLGWPGL